MDEKKIIIEGTCNRYQIKKLVHGKCSPKIRKEVNDWIISPELYEEINQKCIIKEMYDLIVVHSTEKKELSDGAKLAKRQIEKKIQSYKQQDVYKNRFSQSDFIDFQNVVAELYKSDLTCRYCETFVYLLYEHVRENYQWTLDRINNDIGHNNGNVIISCLECNLKRRRTNNDAFLFTKKMQIVKISSEI